MLRAECINPKDVLAHLHSLGYHDITPVQLKEFIHDLKKLIKYEQKQALKRCVEAEAVKVLCSECGCPCPEYEDVSDKLSSNECYCESSDSACSTSVTYSQQNNSKFYDNIKNSGRNTAETDFSQKVHTSFIRPWNLQGCKDHSARGRTPDPVRLYHQYKEFWKSQNIPGESKHLELRWVIRNKMLGKEPNPRVFI